MSERSELGVMTSGPSSPIKNLTSALELDHLDATERMKTQGRAKRPLALISLKRDNIKIDSRQSNNIFNPASDADEADNNLILKRQKTMNELKLTKDEKKQNGFLKERKQGFNEIYNLYLKHKEDCVRTKNATVELLRLFKSLINICIQDHLLDKISILATDFLSGISSILRQQDAKSDFNVTEQCLLDCFNITSHRSKVECYYEILLQEYYRYNYEFLGVLKLVTIQLILAKKEKNDNISGCLLTLLTYDKRYLFGFDSESVKKTKLPNVIKLLLHLCSYYPSIKFFILCKIVEYCKLEKSEISKYLPQIANNGLLVSLIKASYKEIDPATNVLAVAFIERVQIKMEFVTVKEIFTLDDTWRAKIERTLSSSRNTVKIYELYNHYTNYLWTHSIKVEKRDLSIIKSIIMKVNDSLSFIQNNKSELIFLIAPILSNITNILISLNDLVVLENLANLFFNLFITTKDDVFLKYLIDLNFHLFLNTKRNSQLNIESTNKFTKCFKYLNSIEMKISLFKQLFTIDSLQGDESLSAVSSFIMEHCSHYYELLPNLDLAALSFSSNLMKSLFLCGAEYNIDAKDLFYMTSEWSLMNKMLFQTLSKDHDAIAINFDEEVLPNTCLYKDRNFVKCCFQLYREMKKRSMMKLSKIGDYYLNNVLAIRDADYEQSLIELEFLKLFFQYLKLNGFYQLIIKIYQQLLKIKKFEKDCNKELTTVYLQIKHSLLGQKINSSVCDYDALNSEIDFDNISILLEQISSFKNLISFKNKISLNFPKIWDYKNESKMSKPLYVKILLFNMSFAMKEGMLLELEDGQHVEALQSYKLVLSLGKSVLKSVNSLSQLTRIKLVNSLLSSFEKIIELILLLGNYLYYEYFIKEFDLILSSINEPMIKFKKNSLSIQFTNLVFDKLEKFEQNILSQVDLSNSDLIFLEYCERENNLDLVFEISNSTNIKLYKDLLLKKNYTGVSVNSLDSPLERLNSNKIKFADYRKLPLNSMKQILEQSPSYLVSYWNDCYKTMGITYEKQISENVSDFNFEDKEFGVVSEPKINDLNLASKIITMDYIGDKLLIGIIENDKHYSIKWTLPEGLVTNFANDLKIIIKASNDSTAAEVTSKIVTKEQRKDWWLKRYTLDSQLENLLQQFMQDGEFMSIKSLFDPKELDVKHPNAQAFQKFLLENELPNVPFIAIRLIAAGTSMKNLKLLDLIPKSADFEKLYEVVCDNKTLLEGMYIEHENTYLVLTDLFHNFPWESMSLFENRNITRVPSLALLKKLLEKNIKNPIKIKQADIALILNPNSDLGKTQQNFEPIFDNIINKKIIGKPPTELQFINFLTTSKLFIYLGHGNGIQYTSARMLKKQKNIAPSFLIGCSSVKITNNNSFFGYGTLISYLIGGCPLVVGNLWDVTDKDIDIFSISLFNKIGIINNPNKILGKSIAAACRESRNECRLRYLNGAAPVVYGLPLNFQLE